MTTTTTTPVTAPGMPEEVVTRTPVQDVTLPGGAGILALVTLDNGHRPHPPQHLRAADHRGAAGHDRRAADPRRGRRDPGRRHHRQAVRLRRRRRPVGRALRHRARAGPRPSPAPATPRSRRSWTCRFRPSPSSTARPWVAAWRSPSRCDHRTISSGVARVRPAGDLPRPGARLGRLLPAAEPHRRRRRPHGDHREPVVAEPDAQGQGGRRARHRRRAARAGRLPRGLAALGRGRARRRCHRAAPRGRPRRGRVGRRVRRRHEGRARQDRRPCPRRAARRRAGAGRAHRDP